MKDENFFEHEKFMQKKKKYLKKLNYCLLQSSVLKLLFFSERMKKEIKNRHILCNELYEKMNNKLVFNFIHISDSYISQINYWFHYKNHENCVNRAFCARH